MKYSKHMLTCACFLISAHAKPQTFDEWFAQNKTHIRYLAAQLTALEADGLTQEASNRIAAVGCQMIDSIEQEEFQLHKAIYTSMKRINPRIINGTAIRFRMTLDTLAGSMRLFRKALTRELANWDTPKDFVRFIDRTYAAMAARVQEDRQALTELLTPDELQLTDGERLGALAELIDKAQAYSISDLTFTSAVIQFICQRNPAFAEAFLQSLNQQQ